MSGFNIIALIFSTAFPFHLLAAAASCHAQMEGDACTMLQLHRVSSHGSFLNECLADLPRWSSTSNGAFQEMCTKALPDGVCNDAYAILQGGSWTEPAITAACGSARGVLVERGATEEDILYYSRQLLNGEGTVGLLQARGASRASADETKKSLDETLAQKGGGGGGGGSDGNTTNSTTNATTKASEGNKSEGNKSL